MRDLFEINSMHEELIGDIWDDLIHQYDEKSENQIPLDDFYNNLKTGNLKKAVAILKTNAHFMHNLSSEWPLSNSVNLLFFLSRKGPASLLKTMWDTNINLQLFLTGNPIQIQKTNEQGQLEYHSYHLSIPELSLNLKTLLLHQSSYIVQSMWSNNNQLALYFSGRSITVPSTNDQEKDEIKKLKINFNSSMENFKAALISRNSKIIKDIWKNNPELVSCFFGNPINLQENNVQGQLKHGRFQLSKEKILQNFKTILASRNAEIIKAMWHDNNRLRLYFSGYSIDANFINSRGQTESQTLELSMPEMAEYFRLVLASHSVDIMNDIWKNNPQFASYFSGNLVQKQFTNEQGNIETTIFKIDIAELNNNFKSALSSRNSMLIRSMWSLNKQFASCFSGTVIGLQTRDDQNSAECQEWQLISSNLLENFKAVLASNCTMVITEMWGMQDSPLQMAIKELNDHELAQVIEAVLKSNRRGKSECINRILRGISNKSILERCLITRNAQTKSVYLKNQINSLYNRIKELESLPISNKRKMDNEDFQESPDLSYVVEVTEGSSNLLDQQGFFSIQMSPKRAKNDSDDDIESCLKWFL